MENLKEIILAYQQVKDYEVRASESYLSMSWSVTSQRFPTTHGDPAQR